MNKFSSAVLKELGNYVYIYSDPSNNEIFYVGKGKGNRVFSHLNEQSDNPKVKKIKNLKKEGLEPKIEILIHGLSDEQTSLKVEAAIIDLIGKDNLTNRMSGYESSTYGRMSVEQIKSTYEREKVSIEDNVILIRVSQFFKYSMPDIELYDYTRGQWKLSLSRAKTAKFAFCVYGGIVQEVYQIYEWFEGGKTLNTRHENECLHGKYEFIGDKAEEGIRNKYKYKSVEHYFKPGNSNPIMYINC
jgi:uncharacterized protein